MSDSRRIELEYAVSKLNWDIIGMCETRRGSEEINEFSEYILYHTKSTKGLNGVGFLVKKHLKKDIIYFKSYSDRVATLNISLPNKNVLSMVQAYAPTEKCKDVELNAFYEVLELALEAEHSNNLIIMGDFNAQIGKALQGEELAFGKYSNGKRSKHGQRLVEFALENNLKFINSMFKIRKNRKWTWQSPSGLYYTEIDYILTRSTVEVHNFDIIQNLNFNTDHRMIRCKIHIDTKKKRKYIKPNQNHTRNLPILTQENGKQLEEKFRAAIEQTDDIQIQYDNFEKEMISLISQIFKTQKTRKEEMRTQIQELLEKRKQLYKKTRTKEVKNRITQISKEINRTITENTKARRKATFEKYIKKTGAVKKAYKDLQASSKWTINILDKTRKTISKRSDIVKEATAFYRELYYTQTITNFENFMSKNSYMFDKIPQILISEIDFSIKTQKNEKAPGEDRITNELIKSISEPLKRPLQTMFNRILEKRTTPNQWSKSITTLLHKKGDRADLNNYRPISLMSNFYKIFSKIVLNRLSKILDENQPCEQAGFRKNFSTIDHIFVVTQLIEKCNEYNNTLYICFIDFTKAFDSIEHQAIWEALTQQGIDKEYVELLYNIYSKCSAKIRMERDGSEFPVRKGVRQGDPLSPKIFSAVLEMVFRKIGWEKQGIKINGEYLSHLRFADDIAIFSEESTQLQEMVNKLARESRKVGLFLNATKTKIITNGKDHVITVEGQNIEYVSQYIYLGQSISFEDQTETEINRRIATAWKKYWGLKEIMKNRDINIKIKSKLYNMVILPCLTYGCQTWSLRKKDENKLSVHQRKMERSMLDIKLSDKIKNKIIRKKTQVTDIHSKIRNLKWKWAGHVCRMPCNRWARKLIEWIPLDGKRNKGRPRRRWEDAFTEICGPMWRREARYRDRWRKLGEAYATEATSTSQ